MAVIYNTNYTHNPNAYLTLGVERAARNLFGKDQVVVADNMSLGQVAASGEHDTLICIDGQRINTQLLRRVRPAFRTMILWTFEDPFMRDFNVDNASLFDFVFTNDPSCASYYLGKGHYLPLAASQSIHERKIKTSAELDYDIFFAGTMWPNRVATLRHVIAAFPDARLKLICPGNEYLPPLPDDIAALAIQRPVSHEAFIDFANASAITLTMFRDYASHGDISQATAPGPRYYELALAGTAQVVEAPEIMDARYFEDVSGVALARDMKGVVDAIARLLSDPQAREDAAHRAQKSVLEHHLYENRLRRIAEISGADFGRRQQSLSRPPRRRRLRILMCTHSTIHEQAWGGVEVYQQTLCALLGREIEFFYWLRRGVHCRLTSASGQELERYDVPEVGWMDAMCDGAEEMAFSNAISQYNIDIVHFQHLGHHALSLPIIAKACGTGVVFSAHDFWLVSSRYNLLNHELRYNEGEVMSVVAQDVVLKAAENIEYGCEETRRAFVSKMLHSVDAILFGTRHSHDLTHTVYPILDQKQSLTLGIPSPENTVPVTRKSFEPLGDRPLAIAIVGNFLRTKGADTILSLIDIAHPDYFEFHIFGYVHPEYDAVLKAYNRRNVKTYGRYTAGDIEALKIADVALNLSIWPETYCISLSEAWQNGLIPIVTDVGALGDRVVDGVNGFEVPIGRPSAVLERLELLRSSDAMRRRMMENITSDLWTNAQRYGEELKRVYESVAPVRELGIAELAIDSGQVHLIPHASWRHQAPPRHIFDPPTIRDLSIELPEVPEDWIDIQGGECYVDDVCNFILAEGTDDEFPGAQSFHLRGWYFVPGVRGSGTMYVTLIGAPDRPVIFIECTRELRGDIVSLFPDAPRRSGFNCEVALRGKWCEGSYRVGLVNVVNGQGTFQLTTIEIDVTGGAVVALRRSPPSNQTIMTGFSRVIHEDGILREVKLARIAQSGLRREDRASVEWYLDRLGQEPVTTGACEPETDIPVGGWAFMPGATGSGQLYIACVSDVNEEVFLFAMHRLARADVRKVHLGAPLMSGFSGNLRLGSGYARTMDGSYRVCIVNVVGEVIGVVLTNFGITTRSGVMVSIEHVDVSVEMSERVSALLGKKAFA